MHCKYNKQATSTAKIKLVTTADAIWKSECTGIKSEWIFEND